MHPSERQVQKRRLDALHHGDAVDLWFQAFARHAAEAGEGTARKPRYLYPFCKGSILDGNTNIRIIVT